METIKAAVRLALDERGVTSIEYCLIGSLISMLVFAVVPGAFDALIPYFRLISNAVSK